MSNSSNSTVFNQLITMVVVSIDSENNECVVNVAMNGKQHELHHVKISSLLKWKFENQKIDYKLNYVYECVIADKDWKAMPFQLICYGSKDNPEYLLECVNVAKSQKIVSKDVFGNELVDYKNKYHKAVNYRRFRNYVEYNVQN